MNHTMQRKIGIDNTMMSLAIAKKGAFGTAVLGYPTPKDSSRLTARNGKVQRLLLS